MFAFVLLQLLLKQTPKQKLSKSIFIHSGLVNSSGFTPTICFTLMHTHGWQ